MPFVAALAALIISVVAFSNTPDRLGSPGAFWWQIETKFGVPLFLKDIAICHDAIYTKTSLAALCSHFIEIRIRETPSVSEITHVSRAGDRDCVSFWNREGQLVRGTERVGQNVYVHSDGNVICGSLSNVVDTVTNLSGSSWKSDQPSYHYNEIGAQLPLGSVFGHGNETGGLVCVAIGCGHCVHSRLSGSFPTKNSLPGGFPQTPSSEPESGSCGAQAAGEHSKPVGISRYQLFSGFAVLEFFRSPAGGAILGGAITCAIFGVAAFVSGYPSRSKRDKKNRR